MERAAGEPLSGNVDHGGGASSPTSVSHWSSTGVCSLVLLRRYAAESVDERPSAGRAPLGAPVVGRCGREAKGLVTLGNVHAERLQMARGRYLNAMALADQVLTMWFFCRLGVHSEELDTFRRLVESGSLQSRIDLFAKLGDGPDHRDVAKRLREANDFRNQLAHGQVFPASSAHTSFPEVGEKWVIEVSKRTGIVRVPVTAADIDARRRNLVDAVNKVHALTIQLPQR